MIRLAFYSLIVINLSLLSAAWGQSFVAQPGSTGIYLSFGPDMPKSFRYRLERSPAGRDAWEQLTETAFPRLAQEFTGRLSEAVAQLPSSNQRFPKSALAAARFAVLQRNATTDSLRSLMVIPHYQIAAGMGYWDASAQSGVTYDYRFTRLIANGQSPAPIVVRNVKFPGVYPPTVLRTDTSYTTGATATLEYEVVSGRAPEVLTLYRAYYLKGNYEKVVATYFPVASTNGRIRYRVIDATVTDKLSYAYYVVPGDYLGNQGSPSDVRNLYNARPNEVTYIPDQFRVKSATADNALRLSWRLKPSKEITSVDIFRGNDFDKTFVRLGSVGSADSVFIDRNVEPVRTYFYALVVNTIYGKTYPSARVPGLLEGNQKNYARPTGFQGSRSGRVLTFTWDRPAGSIYGYYLYRSTSYSAKPEQVGAVILSKDSVVTVTDTLPDSGADPWIYSVASVNTSYNISTPSERITFPGDATILPPADVTVRLRNNQAHITWTNMIQRKQRTTGFQLYRRELSASGKLTDWQPLTRQPLEAETNFFVDSTIESGKQYTYTIRTVGLGDQLSSYSMEARCTVPETFPAAIHNIRLLQTGKAILIQWDAPFDASIERLVVYRGEAGQELQRLKELGRSSTRFTDEAPIARRTYYYRIVSENRRKQQSRNPDTIGIYVE